MKIFSERKKQLREILKDKNLDAILIFSSNHDARYTMWIAGLIPGLYNYYFIDKKKSGFLEIDYFIEEIKPSIKDEQIFPVLEEDLFGITIKSLCKGLKRVGIVGLAPARDFLDIKIELINVSNEVNNLLVEKNVDEIEKIKKAAQVNNEAFEYIKKLIKPGITEKEIGRKMQNFLLSQAESLSFPVCVTSGDQIELTTASFPRSRKLGKKDIICIDIGVVRDGFNSDSTRMFFINNKEAEKSYSNLREAHFAVIKRINKETKIKNIVELYKEELMARNLSTNLYVKDLGHSVGFGLHEPPMISREDCEDFKMRENMVFTLEPEIDCEGYKIRVEDMILFKNGKARIITN
ncbi:MAG: M24 family metallopeptidase [Candidatus Dojkabacteria bacterium]